MSHAAFIQFKINVETEKREIQDIKDNLEQLKNITNSSLVKSSINKIMIEINSIYSQIIKIGQLNGEYGEDKNSIIEKYNIEKSKLLKVVQNMSIDVSFDDIIKETTQQINNLILENGFLSKIVLEKLKNKNIELNPKNFNDMLAIVKQEKIDEEKHSFLKEELKKYVLKQDIDPKLKGSLLNEFMFISNYQELSDYAPYVKEIINKYNEALNKNKVYSEIFKKYKYKHKSIEFVIQTDPENKLKPKYSFISKFKNPLLKNNAFTLTLNLEGTVSYDIGDYEGHMCWSLAETVEQDLKKYGYFKSSQIITRGVSGARPLTKAQKMKVNTK
ncbi:hypothetical protein [Mycoplasma sp. CSL7503-lung]|uniref:hypothetical protein n=1 Tax=Mycoplasma sp. CSL7503-lung TaxID=536372 RepID=UPI0021D1319C|nr:hypothetical protein [Mycoplasma sp. CSL7503-lung]MCU4706353.1 hypothetical protein [Mycoplasma sp. CSL7503-lung]